MFINILRAGGHTQTPPTRLLDSSVNKVNCYDGAANQNKSKVLKLSHTGDTESLGVCS